ncbi:MAG TPA: HPr family phosphocarrier protein [Treponema sp.]|jgi:phosphocarrier protein|uniref:HPr family phosphocarrier protein n=1 Tax=Gracilinema caldarium TaxID=215591 RepID=UPI0016917449|nr:HPr family phosphocarrier protein [Gracilinema caldarium]NLJ09313.1 HPr family phosphocarrier protein [Treponema sp.]HON12740.1 HPr family phosphocarrier protein [Treponema sp.]HPC70836.1 HPr family phosphocarrier protein [Treponema sp.]HRS05214.1 HPr family phosphocarrier protein [Treponema sp.]HRU30000.1 HPr family phosphocarrier protein [Treponema sp.]
MVEQMVTIKNRAGIHARPAALLVQTASKFKSKIYIEKDSDRINGKSIMGIITLGAGYDTNLKLIADGEDEQEAIQALIHLFDSKFEED